MFGNDCCTPPLIFNPNHRLPLAKNNKNIPLYPDPKKYTVLPQFDTSAQQHNTIVAEKPRNDSQKQSYELKTFKKDEETTPEMKPSHFLFFAANSTFHGMSHIFTPEKFTLRRLLWALAFVLSFALLLNQAYDRYVYYISRPHVTKLDEREVEEMNFPAVTICNINSFRVKEITRDDYYYVGEHILKLFTPGYDLKKNGQLLRANNSTWPGVFSQIEPILQQRNDFSPTSSTFNISEFYDRTGHALHGGMLKQCKYRGGRCESKRWSTVFTRYGKCYTFNSGRNKSDLLKTPKGGVDNGLEILLDTEQDNYMPVWAESDEISVEAGFKVQIHSQNEPPFIHELGFGISPGFQTLVATQEQRITFLPSPFGTCEKGFDKSLHSHFENYSISACRITCETKYVVNQCGCRMVHMPGNARFCSPPEYKECADVKLNKLLESNASKCACETPCEVIRYNLEMSSLLLPSAQALAYVAYKYNKSRDYVRKNFAKLNIFFEALNYETIDQKKAYELPGLLGDIGGQMGLFIGASILTVLELVDFVYEFLKKKTLRALKKRNSQQGKRKQDNMTEMIGLQRPTIEDKPVNSASYHTITRTLPDKVQSPSHRIIEDREASFIHRHSTSFDNLNVITARDHETSFSPVLTLPVVRRDLKKASRFRDASSFLHRDDGRSWNSRIARPNLICDDTEQSKSDDLHQKFPNLLPLDGKFLSNSAAFHLPQNLTEISLRETEIL